MNFLVEGTTGAQAISDGLTTVAGDMTSIVSDVVPIALGIVGTVMVVTFGIKLFRKLTGRA